MTATTTNERVERFKAEAAELNLKAGNPNRESQLQVFGVLLIVAGIAVAWLAYFGSPGLSDQRDVQTKTTLAIAGLTLTVTGGFIFLRYSLGKFFRLWLLRQMYEGQMHTELMVDAVKQR